MRERKREREILEIHYQLKITFDSIFSMNEIGNESVCIIYILLCEMVFVSYIVSFTKLF